jgi:hypothetical protein
MSNFKSLSKSGLIELITTVERQLAPAINDAKEAAENYSPLLDSRSPFEVGYLGGTIKTALETIEMYKSGTS